jgi:iron complex transport system ATP-binding protein
MPDLLTLEAVSRWSNGRMLLDGVSLTVKTGEFVGVIGPNGAGKTTLLSVMAGLVEPNGGRVCLNQVPLSTLRRRQIAQQIACVPQAATVSDFRFSARDIVLMGRYPHRDRSAGETSEDHAIAAEAMRQTQVTSLADRSVTELSGGERQRVTIARALAQQPRLLLLDEPTASLDLSHQLHVLHLVRTLVTKNQLTAVTANHDLELASRFCDRIIVLDHGRIVADGPPEAVLTPDRLATVFGVVAHVRPDPVTNGLMIQVIEPVRDDAMCLGRDVNTGSPRVWRKGGG